VSCASGPDLYRLLVEGGSGDAFDRHVFACAIVIGLAEAERPPTKALGLASGPLQTMLDKLFPHAAGLLSIPSEGGAGEDAFEEPDLRQLLLDHRSRGVEEEEWLAAIVARRAVRPNHLWQDLGLFDRSELNRLLHRHFHALAVQNGKDMKWKKFFYRTLCQRDGILVCKAPNCEVCEDVQLCFGGEEGEPLNALQATLLRKRQS
jgi:nitrogen fixation protein NifQ